MSCLDRFYNTPNFFLFFSSPAVMAATAGGVRQNIDHHFRRKFFAALCQGCFFDAYYMILFCQFIEN
ncbi:hypothetical protein Metme_1025 [Methylomonas methanica MC09]|uniref:Uncharacterized protein n=1 Tax=Methylomonas methanica (strain DSM 25384 / MC09) TaxID=857087 RepID=F9ZV28_METMM|nr:hypothetical protein Metme_1025 [Methylomonas methanica MC09]